MPCFSQTSNELFQKFQEEELLAELEVFYQNLLEQRKDTIEYGADPKDIAPKILVALNLELFEQIQIHRTERLFAAVDSMLIGRNIYGVALSIRGFFETTALIGYMCNRLESFSDGNIDFDKFEKIVANSVVGTRHEQFVEAPPPPNIMTCIEKADIYTDQHLFEERKAIIRDCYDWLSDFAHPNFLSNISAFKLDKENFRIVFQHEHELDNRDFDLLGYLGICSGIFKFLQSEFRKRAVDGCLD